MSDHKKILSQKELFFLLSKLKNKKIIHCHGVFDLLHPGHIDYFKEAKQLGDILIVSITADNYVNKGPYKPVFKQNLRALSLANLELIDYVIINNQSTAVKLINLIKPTFYIKGPDYKNKTKDKNLLKEKKAVENNSGKFYTTAGKIFSSTKILNENFIEFSKNQKDIIKQLKLKKTISNLNLKLNELKKLKVLVLGETIIDEYVFCETIGKSGKEPVMVNKKIEVQRFAGGSVSIANSIAKFCDKVEFFTYLGDKRSETKFIKNKLEKNVNLNFVNKQNSPTIIKSRLVDKYSGSKLSAIYDLNDAEIDEKNENILINKLKNKIEKCDLIVITDYGHGLLTEKIINLVEQKAKYLSLNIQLNALNSSYQKIEKYRKADLICLHERELQHYLKTRDKNNDNLISKLKKILKFKQIIITKGNKGSTLYSQNQSIECPAFANDIVDRIGAGDTLFGVASIFMYIKFDKLSSMFISNIVAGDSIKNIGTESLFSKEQLIKTVNYLLK
jgi:rfaE bifunctional protein kinase chain/domain/rfaE bifunctional protein nucleotidyltransferase chain/domain